MRCQCHGYRTWTWFGNWGVGLKGKGEGEGEGERKGRERADVVHGMGRCLHVLLTCFRLAGGWDGKRCVRGDGRCVSFSLGTGH